MTSVAERCDPAACQAVNQIQDLRRRLESTEEENKQLSAAILFYREALRRMTARQEAECPPEVA